MKKRIFLASVILLLASGLSFAQNDGFFNNWSDLDNSDATNGFDMPGLPGAHGDDNDQSGEAPLGTGLLMLTALGAGYAVTKKVKSRK